VAKPEPPHLLFAHPLNKPLADADRFQGSRRPAVDELLF
jgi:hypothetical protein